MLKKKNKGLRKGQNGFNINRRIFLFSFNFLLLASSLCIQIWHCYFFGFLTRLDDAMVVVDGDGGTAWSTVVLRWLLFLLE